MESVALKELGSLQKRVERGEWLTSTLGWVDWPDPKEEGLRKPDGHGIGARPSGGGGGARICVQQQSRPAAADHGETGRDDDDGTSREPPLTLGGGW